MQQADAPLTLNVDGSYSYVANRPAAEALVRRCMEGAMTLSVPLVVDIGWGANWVVAVLGLIESVYLFRVLDLILHPVALAIAP